MMILLQKLYDPAPWARRPLQAPPRPGGKSIKQVGQGALLGAPPSMPSPGARPGARWALGRRAPACW
jgi:hypothetical protein